MRWMIRRDLPAAEAILATSSPPFNWDRSRLEKEISAHSTIGLCCEYGNTLLGLVVYDLDLTRAVVRNFAVRADMRRQMIGSKMVDDLIRRFASRRIIFQVPADNYAMQCLLRSRGVRATEVLYRRREVYQFEVPPQVYSGNQP